MSDMKWFSDYKDWQKYIKQHMKNAEEETNSLDITIRNRRGEIIAKWNIDGSGQVFENRSKERLDNDRK